MNDALKRQDEPEGAAPALVYALFFLSGVAALVYEASWSRLVGLAVGNTAQAAALVLSAMFTGMAAGQLLGGLLAARTLPLLGYGVAELVAASWACLVPGFLGWVGSSAGQGETDWFRDLPGGRSAWCFLVLLPATVPLGATLPFVVETLTAQSGSRHRAPFAYGLNTAGGLVGTIAATAFLLIAVGIKTSGLLAAALSAACGVVACAAAFAWRVSRPPASPAGGAADRASGSWGWFVVAAASGFGTLGLEVLHTRMFALVFHNSAYTFGAVVAAFLLALSLGAAIASRLGRRLPPRRIAAAAFSLGGLALAVSVTAFPRLTGLSYFSAGESFAGYLFAAFGLVTLFVLPPVTLLGMALPAALQSSADGGVGRLAALNTLAAAVGALAAGFLLPPLVGLWPSFGLLITLFSVCGAVLLVFEKLVKLAVALTLAGAMSLAVIVMGPTSAGREAGAELVRRWESAYGWVDVVRSRKDGSLEVRQNLHYQHGSTARAVREYRQGRLPLLLHPRPREVAFLGLGTGLTATPAVVDRDVHSAVVIELIPEVVEASRLLVSANLGVADHPKVVVRVDDARHHLLRTRRRFDVVVSDLFVPWESRAGYLYTVEFYETVRRRLEPGGLFCQWLALYQVGPEEFQLIADSFSSVFPQTTLWWGQFDARYPIVALVGSEGPLEIDAERLEERLDAQEGLPGGADPDLRIAADLPALYLGDWTPGRSRGLNTDEHPRLEFAAPVSQRSGRTLHGPALRSYFDGVFARLPSAGVRFGGELGALVRDEKRRRALQRLCLFGDVKSET